jgi:hypothetical protein
MSLMQKLTMLRNKVVTTRLLIFVDNIVDAQLIGMNKIRNLKGSFM